MKTAWRKSKRALAVTAAVALFLLCPGSNGSAAGAAGLVGSDTLPTAEGQAAVNVDALLAGWSLEEKVAQLFFVTPEALTQTDGVTMAGEVTRECFWQLPVGGIIYFENNIVSGEQLRDMLTNMQAYSTQRLGIPIFLGTDEEGGRVTRLSGVLEGVPYVPPMLEVGETQDASYAREVGHTIGTYLADYGFNLDFAPSADVFRNPENTVIGDRAFGCEAAAVSKMLPPFVTGLQSCGVHGVLKHFPGHGDTLQDSHEECASTERTLDELREEELLPFAAGIAAGAQIVMVGHISLPQIVTDGTPASLSYEIMTELLREEMGFDGMIITDAMNMGAITQQYDAGEAAVLALEAGADMILMPEDFPAAVEAVLTAAETGRLSEERIDLSLRRILAVKLA